MGEAKIEVVLLDLALRRGAGKTFCPSEAARLLAEDWRPLMPVVRRVAARLQSAGALRGFQKGEVVEIEGARGPIRLGL